MTKNKFISYRVVEKDPDISPAVAAFGRLPNGNKFGLIIAVDNLDRLTPAELEYIARSAIENMQGIEYNVS